MKIICIDANYPSHNKENNQTLIKGEAPVVFLKPDTSLLKDNKPFFLPDFSKEIRCEAEIVIKINRLGKNIATKFASRYYGEATVGIGFTAHDLQRKLKEEGKPWEISKGFDYSAVVGEFVPLDQLAYSVDDLPFGLDINGSNAQKGNTKDMICKINEIISYASRFFTLKIGDLIFTGAPEGARKVERNDRLDGYIGEHKLFSFQAK